jgi:hypothetical protein
MGFKLLAVRDGARFRRAIAKTDERVELQRPALASIRHQGERRAILGEVPDLMAGVLAGVWGAEFADDRFVLVAVAWCVLLGSGQRSGLP